MAMVGSRDGDWRGGQEGIGTGCGHGLGRDERADESVDGPSGIRSSKGRGMVDEARSSGRNVGPGQNPPELDEVSARGIRCREFEMGSMVMTPRADRELGLREDGGSMQCARRVGLDSVGCLLQLQSRGTGCNCGCPDDPLSVTGLRFES